MKRPSISFPAKGLQPLQPMQPMPVPNNLTSQPPQPIPVTWHHTCEMEHGKAMRKLVFNVFFLFVCLPACLAVCLPVCLFVCLFVCGKSEISSFFFLRCNNVRLSGFFFNTRHAFPTLLLGDANADAGAVVCRCIAYSEVKTTFHPKPRLFDYEYERFPPVSVSGSMLDFFLETATRNHGEVGGKAGKVSKKMVEKLPTETVETLAPTEPEKEPVKVHGPGKKNCWELLKTLGAFQVPFCCCCCCCGCCIFEACCFVRDSIL